MGSCLDITLSDFQNRVQEFTALGVPQPRARPVQYEEEEEEIPEEAAEEPERSTTTSNAAEVVYPKVCMPHRMSTNNGFLFIFFSISPGTTI